MYNAHCPVPSGVVSSAFCQRPLPELSCWRSASALCRSYPVTTSPPQRTSFAAQAPVGRRPGTARVPTWVRATLASPSGASLWRCAAASSPLCCRSAPHSRTDRPLVFALRSNAGLAPSRIVPHIYPSTSIKREVVLRTLPRWDADAGNVPNLARV